MKKNISRLLLFFGTVAFLSTSAPGCKSKPKDSDLDSKVEAALQANAPTAGLTVDVKDAVATVSGQVSDPSAQSSVSTIAGGVKGVKSVNNNVTVMAPPAPVEITADDPLSSAVRDATKDFPGVTATVRDGIISVTGQIKTADWKRLKMSLDGLKPKKVDAAGLTIMN